MDTIAIFDILILAAIAGFILFKLWSVLGTRTGHERPPERQPVDAAGRRVGTPGAPAPASERPVIAPIRPPPAFPVAVDRGFAEIAAVDRNFDPAGFMSGAEAGHERVLQSFAAGDRAELRTLLDDDLYQAFEGAIAAREAKNLTASTTIVRQSPPQIIAAALKGRIADVTVRYESEIIQFSKNQAGEVVEGSDSAVKTVIDRWTWSRDVKSSDPNWKLDVTDTGD